MSFRLLVRFYILSLDRGEGKGVYCEGNVVFLEVGMPGWFWGILGAVAGILFLVLLVAFICFMKVFYSPRRNVKEEDEYDIPPGDEYVPFHEMMVNWIRLARSMPREAVEITSFDGTTLRGYYYEHHKGAPVEILFHGYRGNGERDLSGGIERCFCLGRSALIVDHRGNGRSDGHVITFGVRERRDCLCWIDFAIRRFGEDVKLILGGVSMGAATVVMASGEPLPPQVKCIMADCGYSSQKDIICKVIREMHLPYKLLYPFVKLGARLYGGFNLEEVTPVSALEKCTVPMIFIHGTGDAFVPHEMSQILYDACPTKKSLVFIDDAAHGTAYPQDKARYVSVLKDFEMECGFLN